jgi:class 3 adenylate cyclase/tetratricopeptide (TPR) repeat protein
MICHSCGEPDVTGGTCRSCGTPLGRSCPSCGFANVAESRFCGGCGRGLEEAQAEDASGERRQITCLFIDLVGSTELSQSLDPEDLRDHLAAYQSACSDAVEIHGGHIAQFLGDGIVVYFGYPKSHEDDAQRAVRCALDILDEIDQLNQDRSGPARIRVRMGAHTGRVVVGPVGAGDRFDRIALGDTPNIAARLEGEAEAGTVAVSEATWSLVGGSFTGRSLGRRLLRGVKDPLEVWVVEGRGHSVDLTGRIDTLSPLMGRQRELASLRSAVEKPSASGSLRVVVLRGEAGIGKSRLLRQLVADLEDSDRLILATRSTPSLQNIPFAPIQSVLETMAVAQDSIDTIGGIESLLGRYDLRTDSNVAHLAALIGVPVPDSISRDAITPARQRVLTMELLMELLARATAAAPTVVVLEDFHWADASTHEWLERLIDAAPPIALTVLIATRPTLQSVWMNDPLVDVIDLDRFDPKASAELAETVAGGKKLPREALRQIVQRSEGVPLYIEELTRSALDSGFLIERNTAWEVASDAHDTFIPASVDSSLTARIDSIGASRATAQLAAAIGREFDLKLLKAVSPRDENTVENDVKAMIAAGLADRSEHDGNQIQFRHALLRDAAYNTLLRASKRSYHQRIARGLAASPDKVAPVTLAYHQHRAADYAAAAPNWIEGAHSDLASNSMFEAAAHMSLAIDCLAALDATVEVKTLELELQSQIWALRAATEGWGSPAVEQACLRGLELAGELERYDLIYVPLWGLWTVYFLRGQMDSALDTARQVHTIAEASGVPMLILTSEHALGYTHLFRGELTEALAAAERGLALFDADQEREIANTFQLASSLALLAIRADVAYLFGSVADAERDWDALERLARELEHPPSLAAGLAFLLHGGALRHSANDSVHRLGPVIGELIDVTEDEGSLLWNANARCFEAVLLASAPDSRHLDDAWDTFAQTGTGLTEVLTRVLFAEYRHRLGDAEGASNQLDLAEAAARDRGEGLLSSETWRIRGRIAADAGRMSDAKAAFSESLAIAEAQGARMLCLRTLLDRAEAEQGSARNATVRAIADLLDGIDGASEPEVVRAHEVIDLQTEHNER